jgi:hypothetical protein
MNLYIVDYSEKAIALFGDSTDYKVHILNAGGKYNPSLRHNEQRQAGWIFPKTKKAEIEKLVNQIKSGSIEEKSTPTPAREYKKKTEPNDSEWVSKQDFMNLVSKVERLEQEYNRLLKMKNKEEQKEQKEPNEPLESEEEESEEEEKPKRLLRKK